MLILRVEKYQEILNTTLLLSIAKPHSEENYIFQKGGAAYVLQKNAAHFRCIYYSVCLNTKHYVVSIQRMHQC